MAAKKTTKKPAPKKAVKKTTVTTPKKPAAKKPAVKKAPAKKTVLKTVKKPVVKKEAPAKKAVKVSKKAAKPEVKVLKKANAPAKAAPAPVKAEKKPAASKVKAPVRKSSLVDTPPPPAPYKPPFVPPKSAPVNKLSSNGSGTHSPVFIKKQQQRLLDLRDSLVDSMTGMTRDTIRNAPEGSEASGSGQHQGDAGSDAYDRDFALSVLAKEQDALYEIEQALYRIKTGTYGNCEISLRKIPTARLEAIPFARLTVECQADWEKEYGSRRFRPSDEVGFSGGKPQEDEDSVTVSLDGDDD